jgi:hypothetical protein
LIESLKRSYVNAHRNSSQEESSRGFCCSEKQTLLDYDNGFHCHHDGWLDFSLVWLFRPPLHGGSDTPGLPMGTPLVRLVVSKGEFLESMSQSY